MVQAQLDNQIRQKGNSQCYTAYRNSRRESGVDTEAHPNNSEMDRKFLTSNLHRRIHIRKCCSSTAKIVKKKYQKEIITVITNEAKMIKIIAWKSIVF